MDFNQIFNENIDSAMSKSQHEREITDSYMNEIEKINRDLHTYYYGPVTDFFENFWQGEGLSKEDKDSLRLCIGYQLSKFYNLYFGSLGLDYEENTKYGGFVIDFYDEYNDFYMTAGIYAPTVSPDYTGYDFVVVTDDDKIINLFKIPMDHLLGTSGSPLSDIIEKLPEALKKLDKNDFTYHKHLGFDSLDAFVEDELSYNYEDHLYMAQEMFNNGLIDHVPTKEEVKESVARYNAEHDGK